MVFFQNEPRREQMPPVYDPFFGPSNQMRRQPPPQFFESQPRPNFFMPNLNYQQMFNEQPQPSNFYGFDPNQQLMNPFMSQPFSMQQNQGPFQQQQIQQQPQQPQSPFGRFPDTLNTIMGHAGTLQNGFNMMRQLSSFLRLLR